LANRQKMPVESLLAGFFGFGISSKSLTEAAQES
jgi:hypothetical protein